LVKSTNRRTNLSRGAIVSTRSPRAVCWAPQPRNIASSTASFGVLAALDQRIGLRYTMPTMTDKETASYLRHHLKLAGRDDTLFSDDAVGLIHQTSRGYPRAVNNLALQALVAAFGANKAIVDESSTRAAVAEVTAD
jgi:hypothetical protein